MAIFKYIKCALVGTALSPALVAIAAASQFDISGGDLKGALDSYAHKTGIAILYLENAVEGVHTRGAKGDLSDSDALSSILAGTGFIPRRHPDGTVVVVRKEASTDDSPTVHIAAAATPIASGAALETVTVTSSKIAGDVQNIPISITALSQEQLTATQTAGGPDLVKQVPNMSFSKTNFTGYNIEIRGIGTQAISVTTDPAVAVAFNDTPFIRNHFFEQEFYDVSQVAVLRGPQGTLYGRNATAGVVNLTSAKPTDQFEALASADLGNYNSRRFEGMVNIPIVDDRLDVRIAGEWTKRRGYTFNETNDTSVDGRDLWSGRVTVGWKPTEKLQTYLVWEHFSEDDDRERSTKQLCKRDPGPDSLSAVDPVNGPVTLNNLDFGAHAALSQGCLPVSAYSPDAYETPNGAALPIVFATQFGSSFLALTVRGIDPYQSATQSQSLRVIQSELTPTYKVKNDTIELNSDYTLTPAITLTSQTGYNNDRLISTQDFNRFNSRPGLFFTAATDPSSAQNNGGVPVISAFPDGFGEAFSPNGVFCDPQLGCSTKFIGEDLSQERAWQIGQEFRISSNFKGPVNFSAGANYLHYETLEDYYVFLNLITLESRFQDANKVADKTANGLCESLPSQKIFPVLDNTGFIFNCPYTDPQSISEIETKGGNGHNYFRSVNPYLLDSYAGFGEVNYQALSEVKFTGGLRWTNDRKHFVEVPSEILTNDWGYPVQGVVDQHWSELTGRFVANWTPTLSFTDQTLVYASYAHGYKAGGANPPGPNVNLENAEFSESNHPLTFKPEFIDAYEIGTKDTLLDGSLTLNGDIFYYDYQNYQISQIVDRTSINLNFNTNVRGAEVEGSWEPLPGLRFNFAGGWEDTKLASGSKAIDLIDRTAGTPGWVVMKPNILSTSNCILPTYLVTEFLADNRFAYHVDAPLGGGNVTVICTDVYTQSVDPLSRYAGSDCVPLSSPFPPGPCPYQSSSFDPSTAPNGGAGFDKNLAGNQLPNAPPLTASMGAQYTLPLSPDWAGTLRGDYYWQDYSWARVFNDNPYDRLRGYTNVNLSLIFTNQSGWQVMLYDKNVFNTTAITGTFLNSDDTDLTTNVFVTDPRLIGIRVTKNW